MDYLILSLDFHLIYFLTASATPLNQPKIQILRSPTKDSLPKLALKLTTRDELPLLIMEP